MLMKSTDELKLNCSQSAKAETVSRGPRRLEVWWKKITM